MRSKDLAASNPMMLKLDKLSPWVFDSVQRPGRWQVILRWAAATNVREIYLVKDFILQIGWPPVVYSKGWVRGAE